MVKKNKIYIFNRCPSNNRQILYSEERYEDLFEIIQPLEVNGV